MLRKSLLVFFILCAAILIGCSKTETSNSNTAADNSNKSGTSTSGTTGTTSSGDKIGVAECDDYIAKYESCLRDKVPPASRAQMEASFKQARDAWKKAAETPQGKTSLAAACKQASDAAAAGMKAYGCAW
ncbi:MAG TPA: hypothetical protein VHQ64_00845 [Pyrinomonadaceae bacterium]|jgi:hypothetical protein|nr:hypothetical protein [Pyrinomonadaceae bacterium]